MCLSLWFSFLSVCLSFFVSFFCLFSEVSATFLNQGDFDLRSVRHFPNLTDCVRKIWRYNVFHFRRRTELLRPAGNDDVGFVWESCSCFCYCVSGFGSSTLNTRAFQWRVQSPWGLYMGPQPSRPSVSQSPKHSALELVSPNHSNLFAPPRILQK